MSTEDLLKELQKGGTDEQVRTCTCDFEQFQKVIPWSDCSAVGQLCRTSKSLTAEAFLAKVQDETFISQAAKYPTLLESLPVKDSKALSFGRIPFPAIPIKESTIIESLIDEMLAAMDKNSSPYYSTIKS